MKTAKFRNIILLLSVFALSLVCGLSFMNFGVAKAVSASAYFTYVLGSHSDSDVKFEDGKVKIPMKTGDTIKLKNKLVFDEFATVFEFPSGSEEVTVSMFCDSFDANGNKKVSGDETTYETLIENKLVLTLDEGRLKAVWNDGTEILIDTSYSFGEQIELKVFAVNNYLEAVVNDVFVPYTTDAQTKKYYKLDQTDKVVGEIRYSVKSESDVNFNVVSLDQQSSDASGNFKQTFELDGNNFVKTAFPRITLNKSFFPSIDGEILEVENGRQYTITLTSYSVLGNVSNDSIKIVSDSVNEGKLWVGDKSSSSKVFVFSYDRDNPEVAFNFVNKASESEIYEEYTAKVVPDVENGKGNAPAFRTVANGDFDEDALESFKVALLKNLKSDYVVNGVTEKHYIRIGSDQYLELPSMRNLVKDDLTSYENLKYTICYKSETAGSTYSSKFRLPVETAGKYVFYVLFEDFNGNKIEEDKFFKKDGDKVEYDKEFSQYVFGLDGSIYLEDDAPLGVTAYNQGDGYVGVEYKATAFKISSSGYTAKYSLWYSATKIEKNSTEWVQITKASDAKDEGEDYGGYTYEQIKAINYDGNLSFSPDKVGYYKIDCNVTSSSAERSVSESVIIKVGETTVVRPDSHWLEKNVWSVVFLSVGTLCLIAIIVLLCIKPKEDEDDDVVAAKK